MTEELIEGPEQKKEKWHVEKGIPLSLIYTLIAQTVAFIVGATVLYMKVEGVVKTVEAFSVSRYTQEDAKRDREFAALSYRLLELKDAELERRVLRCEGRNGG